MSENTEEQVSIYELKEGFDTHVRTVEHILEVLRKEPNSESIENFRSQLIESLVMSAIDMNNTYCAALAVAGNVEYVSEGDEIDMVTSLYDVESLDREFEEEEGEDL